MCLGSFEEFNSIDISRLQKIATKEVPEKCTYLRLMEPSVDVFYHTTIMLVLPPRYIDQLRHRVDLRGGLVHLRGPIAALQSSTRSCGLL